jgi:hypothetical protein
VAPDLPRLAFRKKLSVKAALANGAWMRGLQRLTTVAELNQFVLLWERIQSIQLTNEADSIVWSITADGHYSAASAYGIQFVGRIETPGLAKTWKLQAEGKIKFNMWLLLQNRWWTADRLLKRGWPHQDRCNLCDQTLESAFHLVFAYPFAKEVWNEFSQIEPVIAELAGSAISTREWWHEIQTRCIGPGKKVSISTAAYVVWNVWNERNRRIFQDKRLSPKEVAGRVREDISQLRLAFCR